LRRFDAGSVSVIVPVRNGAPYLAEALDSVLGQSTPPGRLIVVDDGSTDDTPHLLEWYAERALVLRQEPHGVGAALNRGVAAARSPLLAFLDADDVWMPTALERRLARMDGPDRPDAVVGRMQQFLSPEMGATHAARFRFDPNPVRVSMFGTMLIRRAVFFRVGLLSTEFVTGSNIDWVSRARAAGVRVAEVPDVVMRRRIHGSNLGITARHRKQGDLLRIVRAHRHRHHPAAEPEADT